MTSGKIFFCIAATLITRIACADDEDVRYFVPQLLSAQYTFIDQHQYPLRSPYEKPLSLDPNGDTEQSHTFGAYFGMSLTRDLQVYFDMEMFKGEGVSGATGLGGLPNGDVIRSGTQGLGKRAYVARRYLRYLLPIGDATRKVESGQDQIGGEEPDTRVEFKIGKFTPSDDFDKNRYANSTRTQFMNWSLFNNTAWDFAADTRGYTNGFLVAYETPIWTLRYGIYEMPLFANGQTLDSFPRARGEQVEWSLQPKPDGWAFRLLAYRNTARMGIYRDAIEIAEATNTVPDIRADDANGRHKYGFGTNGELPLADNGDTGLFARVGWNDGRTESFAFTEVDNTVSAGAQLSGIHWGRAQDKVAVALVSDGLSSDHRDYLALGGSGFLLGDGRLNYSREKIAEAYYVWKPIDHVAIGPDFQFIRDPGYNADRGPAKFIALRVHLEI